MRELLRRAAGRRVTVGFDGFIDTIARPVARTATADAPAQYFESIPAFGQYLVEHGGKCCSIALHVERRQLGGNLPRISTGAGDHFNGASCFALLAGLSDRDRVHFAGVFASTYVSKGSTPTLDEVLDAL